MLRSVAGVALILSLLVACGEMPAEPESEVGNSEQSLSLPGYYPNLCWFYDVTCPAGPFAVWEQNSSSPQQPAGWSWTQDAPTYTLYDAIPFNNGIMCTYRNKIESFMDRLTGDWYTYPVQKRLQFQDARVRYCKRKSGLFTFSCCYSSPK